MGPHQGDEDPVTLPKRSKARITKQGLLLDERMKALRRIQAQLPPPPSIRPTEDEIARSEARWARLRRLI